MSFLSVKIVPLRNESLMAFPLLAQRGEKTLDLGKDTRVGSRVRIAQFIILRSYMFLFYVRK